MSKQDVEKTLVISELQKIFSLREKLTNKVRVIVGGTYAVVPTLYIDRYGYFFEWNNGKTSRKTIKELVILFFFLNHKEIESVHMVKERNEQTRR